MFPSPFVKNPRDPDVSSGLLLYPRPRAYVPSVLCPVPFGVSAALSSYSVVYPSQNLECQSLGTPVSGPKDQVGFKGWGRDNYTPDLVRQYRSGRTRSTP